MELLNIKWLKKQVDELSKHDNDFSAYETSYTNAYRARDKARLEIYKELIDLIEVNNLKNHIKETLDKDNDKPKPHRKETKLLLKSNEINQRYEAIRMQTRELAVLMLKLDKDCDIKLDKESILIRNDIYDIELTKRDV